jgi:preprotein translocase subunit Sec63
MLAEPPSNGEYMVAAYVVTTGILLGYWAMLWRKAKTVLKP